MKSYTNSEAIELFQIVERGRKLHAEQQARAAHALILDASAKHDELTAINFGKLESDVIRRASEAKGDENILLLLKSWYSIEDRKPNNQNFRLLHTIDSFLKELEIQEGAS